ncbi:MAG: DUF4827 domain-containing protein [Prevotella sp.]|nr:DUF4827 domain-containing protein [Bacteroides sp.]MCM1365843.1 DUF4827 domain-containing protein [Prevotella sp.]MCM1436465.1 DUF4827 domain-containing protein [Prevotella sp.]
MRINNIIHGLSIASLMLISSVTFISCDDSKSYSELLNDEEKATNWYMANQKIELTIPEDSVLLHGQDAPFYKMDDDGYLYLKVINPGDLTRRPKLGDMVYFRFSRQNIKALYDGISAPWEGNANDMNTSLGATSIIFGNYRIESTSLYGTGIQVPLQFLGYDCEVEMVMRSYQGFTTDQSQCIPYIYKVKYFKAEY